MHLRDYAIVMRFCLSVNDQYSLRSMPGFSGLVPVVAAGYYEAVCLAFLETINKSKT